MVVVKIKSVIVHMHSTVDVEEAICVQLNILILNPLTTATQLILQKNNGARVNTRAAVWKEQFRTV